MGNLVLKLNGVARPQFVIEKIESGLLGPEKAVFRDEGLRHDEGALVTNDDRVRVEADGETIFDGWVRLNEPQGVAKEGLAYTAVGARWRLENEICARINGSYAYTYNAGGRDSRAPHGGWLGNWSVGEALIDLLEHARGIPETGSAIPRHHTGPEDVKDVYMPMELIAEYDAQEILSLTGTLAEFNLNGMRFGDALTLLADIEGQVGWHIDPATKALRFVRLGTGTTATVSAGEVGRHVDEAGKGYELEDNPLRMSLEEVYTKIVVQGRNKTAEIRPGLLPGGRPQGARGDARLEKGWDPALEGTWQLSRWQAGEYAGDDAYEWVHRRYIARPAEQRVWRAGRMQDDNGRPYGSGVWVSGEIFRGQEEREKAKVEAAHVVYYDLGVVLFLEPYAAAGDEGLWAWYRCEQPFVVKLGPAGSAYVNYGLVSELVVHDEEYEHRTSRLPWSGGYYAGFEPRDDTAQMLELAQRLLRIYGTERVYAEVAVDGIRPGRFGPGVRVNFSHLRKWSNIGLDVLRTTYEPEAQRTRVLAGNDLARFAFGGVRREMERLRAKYEALADRNRLRRMMSNAGALVLPR